MTAKEDKEKEKTRRESLSKFIYQLANTSFTAMVVVAVVGLVLGVDDAKPYAFLLGVGLFATVFLALFADNILKKNLKSATYRVSWEFTCKTTKILLLYIFLGHNRNVVNTKFPYPIKRLEVIRRFNQKSMAFNQSLS